MSEQVSERVRVLLVVWIRCVDEEEAQAEDGDEDDRAGTVRAREASPPSLDDDDPRARRRAPGGRPRAGEGPRGGPPSIGTLRYT